MHCFNVGAVVTLLCHHNWLLVVVSFHRLSAFVPNPKSDAVVSLASTKGDEEEERQLFFNMCEF